MTYQDIVNPIGAGTALQDEIRQKLMPLAEETYKNFTGGLIPTVMPDRILGVRVPSLRKLSVQVLRDHPRELAGYFQALSMASESGDCYHEEKLLWGILLGKADFDDGERMSHYKDFVPFIDNWAVCDIACGSLSWVRGNAELWFAFFQSYLESQNEFEIRFGIVMMLGNYLTDETIDRVLDQLSAVKHPAYYVTMALGWTLAECYIRYPLKTEALLAGGSLSAAVQNKTIQKIRESNCVSKSNKEHMKGYKK